MFQNPSDSIIREILASPRRVAVVGCSPDAGRDSHRIATLLMERGHDVVPVNPAAAEVLGRPCFPSLSQVPGGVEMVDIFRRSEHAGGVVDEAIAIGARIVWLQLDVIDERAAQRASAAGLTVVMNRCPAIEYRRLF
ncbi:MAG: CoA-binding protein [Deltaproteobacteria bacterium]|nr:CoA-binding protein [Deltaproteobacteria bacterium]